MTRVEGSTMDASTTESGRGIDIIAAERRRQFAAVPAGEGWTSDHDAEHGNDELTRAAVAYALSATHGRGVSLPAPSFRGQRYLVAASTFFPWSLNWWKPRKPIRDLARAGALIAAEIDRRLAAGETE